MVPVTLLYYTNKSGDPPKTVYWFNAETSFHDIYQRISEELGFTLFELQIKDPCSEFVDFDANYLKSFKPYGLNTKNLGVQSTTSTGPIVRLRIVDTSGRNYL
jgi:hypothetical protein